MAMTDGAVATTLRPAATTAPPPAVSHEVIPPTCEGTLRDIAPLMEPSGAEAPSAPRRSARSWPTLSVVVPVFNEARTLRTLVGRVLASEFVTEVLLVDDGSSDESPTILAGLAQLPRVLVLTHPQNRGKGAAIRTGFAHASAEVVVVQDADLEYHPRDFERLLEPLAENRADVVFGSRFLSADGVRVPLALHRFANRVLTWFSNRLTGLALTDMETCYKAIRRELLAGLRLREDRFSIEPEITAKLARAPGVRIREVPIQYDGRRHAEGKKISWRDGFAALWAIVKYRFTD